MIELTHIRAATALLVFSALLSCGLGVLVLTRNPWKRTHRMFALLSLNIMLWALGVLMIITAESEPQARFWIKATFATACFLPATFYHFIVFFPYQRFQGVRWALYMLYGGAFALLAGIPTSWYIRELEFTPAAPPLVKYGPLFLAYSVLVAGSMVFSFGNLLMKVRQTSGIQRRQVEHVLVAIAVSTVLASTTNVLAPVLEVRTMELYGPCFMVLLMGMFAYSMVRYHLLDIWVMVSRTTVYAVVTAFVIAVFVGAVSVVHYLFSNVGQVNEILTTALAALVIVLFIQPLRERVQLVLDRLVLHRRYDARALIGRIGRNTSQFVGLEELLERVAGDIQHTLGVRKVRVLLVSENDPGVLVREYSTIAEERHRRILDHHYLTEYVDAHPEPLLLEELLHTRPNQQRVRLAKHLADLDAYMLVPLKTTSGVVGFITLGQKSSRDIYIHEDVRLFSALAGSLATAIENARLYRKLNELNLHLERILRNMRGGVIAVDTNGIITTVNDEARELLGTIEAGQPLHTLQSHVAQLLRHTLDTHRDISDLEAELPGRDGEQTPVALSASCLETSQGEVIGAMVLIYNITQIKRLESNVQRADRLTSIGTMAAGMAHEIKNPLQSIKTFTQLLPSRFEDSDFRRTFCEVVPPEVKRIDSIVARLLDFARPKPACFAAQDIERIIREVLALVENQTRKADITITTDFPAEKQEAVGDDQLLHQVFLNLVLNAIDALRQADERVLQIKMGYGHTHFMRRGAATVLDAPCVRVAVTDTGCGIPEKDVEQLFTPFFTTKADGTGLGLSVVHGIVSEHGGTVEVSSLEGIGTTFTVTLPLESAAGQWPGRNSAMTERTGQ